MIPNVPSPPESPEPPTALVHLADTLSDPQISQVGLTTTQDGCWALLVRVRAGIQTPLPEVESHRGSFPVIYEVDSKKLPIARPAYPELGE